MQGLLRHKAGVRIAVAVWSAVAPVCAQVGRVEELGLAPGLTPRQFQEQTRAAPGPEYRPSAVSGFAVDTANRTEVLAFYHCIYQASEGWESRMNWIGNVSNCVPGTVATAFHEDTLRRINYYRAMAGLNTDIQFVATQNTASQQAALMMARNNQVAHDPPTNWLCWTSNGCLAANNSVLALGTGWIAGPRAVDAFMEDPGTNNQAVAHRRWLLFSRSAEMGNGGIPALGTNKAAAAIWVIGNFNPTAAVAFVAWPPPGYVPYPLVHPRWSFGLPDVSTSAFDSATVSMTLNGAPQPLTVIHRGSSFGDPSIVWEPAGQFGGPPSQDLVYTVVVSNVQGAATSRWAYTVRVMDPDDPGVVPEIAGPAAPVIGIWNSYTFPLVPGAVAYTRRVRQTVETNWTEGAETAPPPRIEDGTSSDYNLMQTAVKESGALAFQLAFSGPADNYVDQEFGINRTLVPATHATLEFSFLRRASSTNNRFRVQISTDDKVTWTDLWATNGVCGSECSSANWDTAFRRPAVSLGAYANQPCRLRFRFEHNNAVYHGTTSNHGVFLDNISVTGVQEVVAETVTALASNATGFVLQPDNARRHMLDVAPELPCVTFPYGPVFLVEPVVGSNPVVRIAAFRLQSTQTQIDLDIQGAPVATSVVERLIGSLAASNWLPAPGAVYDPDQLRFLIPPATVYPVFYRVRSAE